MVIATSAYRASTPAMAGSPCGSPSSSTVPRKSPASISTGRKVSAAASAIPRMPMRCASPKGGAILEVPCPASIGHDLPPSRGPGLDALLRRRDDDGAFFLARFPMLYDDLKHAATDAGAA